MFKADLKSDTLKGLVNIISTLIDEVKFTIGPDGMTLKAVDAAHVAMIEMEVGKDAFESYEADSCEIGLDLDKVKGVLKLASSGDIVSMEQDDTHGRLVFKVGNITRRMNLVDTATMNDPKVPQLSLATSISLMVDELQKGIRAADTISDHITLRAGPDFFELSCEGDTDSVSLRLEGSSLLGIEAAEEGCQIIINNSYGFEPYMLEVVDDYPEITFISCTSYMSWNDGRDNTHNAFANIYEGRYIAGVVAGMKLQQMIDEGQITPEQAVIGYVGAFPFAEVVSGYTSYFLGARSVCPSVTMKVMYVSSWSDATAESDAALALIDQGCVLISQHSDNTTPATAAQSRGVYHTGYNNDMTGIAPDASLIGTRIDWGIYFTEAIRAYVNGEEIPQDWCKGMGEGAVVMTPLNEAIAAPGTAEKIAEVEAAIADGSLEVFDTSTFTVGGQTVTTAMALDTDGDFTPDSVEAVHDGAFHESEAQSAPYFTLRIDGIVELN